MSKIESSLSKLIYADSKLTLNIYVDIDETICFYSSIRDYNYAEPCYKNISVINNLYDMGHTITYWTARGTMTGIDWYEKTNNQLTSWGCKYHSLITGEKPAYDLLICDKTARIEEIASARPDS